MKNILLSIVLLLVFNNIENLNAKKEIYFSGYSWDVFGENDEACLEKDCNENNVEVSNNILSLSFKKRVINGKEKWSKSFIRSKDEFSYGRYVMKIISDMSKSDKHAELIIQKSKQQKRNAAYRKVNFGFRNAFNGQPGFFSSHYELFHESPENNFPLTIVMILKPNYARFTLIPPCDNNEKTFNKTLIETRWFRESSTNEYRLSCTWKRLYEHEKNKTNAFSIGNERIEILLRLEQNSEEVDRKKKLFSGDEMQISIQSFHYEPVF